MLMDSDMETWTDETWAEYDKWVAEEIAAWDEAHADDWPPADESYDGVTAADLAAEAYGEMLAAYHDGF